MKPGCPPLEDGWVSCDNRKGSLMIHFVIIIGHKSDLAAHVEVV